MKRQFVVEVKETVRKKVIVEAEDQDDAWDIAWDLYNHGIVCPDTGKDDLDTHIEVCGEPSQEDKEELPSFTIADILGI